VRQATKIGPESSYFTDDSIRPQNREYILRPETIESYFVLWRVTKDPKYREWGWSAFQSINKYCRLENGFSGIRDVTEADKVAHDGVQQSFFMAETLKYFYLLFSDENVIPLDSYVFNTEAHPLAIFEKPYENWMWLFRDFTA